jgi:transcriptional regulator with XRE-family HTH domain
MWYRIRGVEGLGAALSGARRVGGLTQVQLAARLGAERTTVIAMEAGRNPALARLVRAFSLLGYDLIAVPRTAEVSVREQPAPVGDR